MKHSLSVTIALILAGSGWTVAATAVRVEGVFVQAGTSTQVSQIQVGQDVDLIVRVRDISDSPGGIIGGLVDVTWNSAVLELLNSIDASETTTGDVAALFFSPWTDLFSGVKTGAGSLQNIGAGQPPPFSTNTGGQTVDFFKLRFRAVAAGSANVALAGHGFGLFGYAHLAEAYDAVNPTLAAVEQGQEQPQPVPGGCFGSAGMLVTLMALGFGGLAGRHRMGRVVRNRVVSAR